MVRRLVAVESPYKDGYVTMQKFKDENTYDWVLNHPDMKIILFSHTQVDKFIFCNIGNEYYVLNKSLNYPTIVGYISHELNSKNYVCQLFIYSTGDISNFCREFVLEYLLPKYRTVLVDSHPTWNSSRYWVSVIHALCYPEWDGTDKFTKMGIDVYCIDNDKCIKINNKNSSMELHDFINKYELHEDNNSSKFKPNKLLITLDEF